MPDQQEIRARLGLGGMKKQRLQKRAARRMGGELSPTGEPTPLRTNGQSLVKIISEAVLSRGRPLRAPDDEYKIAVRMPLKTLNIPRIAKTRREFFRDFRSRFIKGGRKQKALCRKNYCIQKQTLSRRPPPVTT